MTFRLALAGDMIINRRITIHRDPAFQELLQVYQESDLAYGHLESILHDYEGPEVYPAAEAGWTWMRSPTFVAEELASAGFGMVSLASNHALDYSYGGLLQTWNALDAHGISHAGTGRNLGEARSPTYRDTPIGRVALISTTSSFTSWSRAGAVRPDIKGRPGINPLRHHNVLDRQSMSELFHLFERMGWWITEVDDGRFTVNAAGTHNSILTFFASSDDTTSTIVDRDDADQILHQIRDASSRAVIVMLHIHNHEWDPDFGLHSPARFLPPFAREAIDAGASLVVAQGSHAPLRGIEAYGNGVIFYDPGDLFRMSDSVTKYPSDFYERHRIGLDVPVETALPFDVLPLRRSDRYHKPIVPEGGYFSGKVVGSIVPRCTFRDDGTLEGVELIPVSWKDRERLGPQGGLPVIARDAIASDILEYVAQLSGQFETHVSQEGDVGRVTLARM